LPKRESKYYKGLKIRIFKRYIPKSLYTDIFDIKNLSILLLSSGSLRLKVNETTWELKAKELMIIPKRTNCRVLNAGFPLYMHFVSFTSEFVFQNSIQRPHIGYFEFFIQNPNPQIILQNEEILTLTSIIRLIDLNLNSRKKNFKRELLLHNFNLLVYEIAGIYHRNSQSINVRRSRKEKLVMDFFRLLEKNCRSEHNVSFYADNLFVTKRHLNKIVKLVVGMPAKQLIEEAIILEAKILLQDDGLTISSISEELRFSSLSSFSNFFKKISGSSPSEYRLGLNIK